MTTVTDLAKLGEDARIEIIGEHARSRLVGVLLERNEPEKIARYIDVWELLGDLRAGGGAMNALAAFATPVCVAIFALGLIYAPWWLIVLWFIGIGWFVVLYLQELGRAPQLAPPTPVQSLAPTRLDEFSAAKQASSRGREFLGAAR